MRLVCEYHLKINTFFLFLYLFPSRTCFYLMCEYDFIPLNIQQCVLQQIFHTHVCNYIALITIRDFSYFSALFKFFNFHFLVPLLFFLCCHEQHHRHRNCALRYLRSVVMKTICRESLFMLWLSLLIGYPQL